MALRSVIDNFFGCTPRKCALATLLILFIFLALPCVIFAQVTPSGWVTALQGKVLIERSGASTFPAQVNQAVQVGDRIITGPASRVTITMADGTQLGLDESSSLMIADNRLDAKGFRARTEVDLTIGLLHSLVRHAPGNAPNYEVHTPNAVAAARGTDYDTRYTEGEKSKKHKDCRKVTDVTVRDGVVEVWNPADPQHKEEVKKGHKTEVGCGYIPDASDDNNLLAGGIIGALVGGGVVAGVGGGFGGGGGSDPPPPHRPPVTASQ